MHDSTTLIYIPIIYYRLFIIITISIIAHTRTHTHDEQVVSLG